MHDAPDEKEGLRERKRRQMLQRIAEVGLDLFLSKGYGATTLDEIAEAAGISRRTFFYYFKSKDDVLLAHLGGYVEALRASVVENSAAGTPVDVARNALLKFSAGSQPSRAIAIARVMDESEALRARVPISYMQFEQALYEGLCELWPGKAYCDRLRLVAMASAGVMRLAAEAWVRDSGKRPLAKHIQDAFVKLKAAIGSADNDS